MQQIDTQTDSPFAAWEAGELSAQAAAEAIVRALIEEIEPQEQALRQAKEARRAELGTLLIRIGGPVTTGGRVARWVEPSATETASVKQLRTLIAELRDQGSPALDGIAARIAACISASLRKGYPLIEAAPRTHRG
jgi:hypothetical protein